MNERPPITVVLDRDALRPSPDDAGPPWERYCIEVLDHLRLPYQVVSQADPVPQDGSGIVLLPGSARLEQNDVAAVRRWIAAGGVAVCVGAGPLSAAFDIVGAAPVDAGHTVVTGENGWVDPPDVALRALGGTRLSVTGSREETAVLARWRDDASPALAVRRYGDGYVIVSGVDLWQTIVRIQQGDPVHQDGEPAADGSAAVDDGVLKCDDGITLTYASDRALPPGPWTPRTDGREGLQPVPVFHRPHADLWRRLFLQLLFEAAGRTGVVLPWLHYWPSGVPAVAHLSVDSDRNVSEEAETTLRLFDEIGVTTTWCHVYPGGYEPDVVRAIAEQGHEHALHYNAVGDADIATWGRSQLRAQYQWARAMTGHEEIVSNKNHYTRWEGWDEFYRWCVEFGIRIDESRGPSKQGNVGFPFGTAHLFFPMGRRAADATGVGSDHGERLDVLVLPMHAQDLAWAAHESVRDVILDQALAHHGVAHFLFHPVHLHRRGYVRDACREVVELARRSGMPWWTAAQLNDWERLRREVTLSVRQPEAGAIEVVARTPRPVSAAAINLALPETWNGAAITVESTMDSAAGTAVRHTMSERHGRAMLELSADLPAGTTRLTLRLSPTGTPAATGGGTHR
ncbi:hypothetical protein [Phytoactinopolyspora halotolerans]|uniref:Polysaccharide deacetylase family protein n=1 Tax=Phytoactinopolyspora halotolerans TaxID=1981512 RepID=A0A6L9SJ48_9ACTN|nr:hypothetical protein [Phytoactinopolyspora halotolerans]NEE04704.1 hypothetical protein [Phytoactinopolyspora halotolerans]